MCAQTYRDADDSDCKEKEVDIGSNRVDAYGPNLSYYDRSDGTSRRREVQPASTYGRGEDLPGSQ